MAWHGCATSKRRPQTRPGGARTAEHQLGWWCRFGRWGRSMTRAEAFREGFVRARRSLVVTTWARLAAFLGAPAVRGPVPHRIVAAELTRVLTAEVRAKTEDTMTKYPVLDETGKVRKWLDEGRGVDVWQSQEIGSMRPDILTPHGAPKPRAYQVH